MVSLRVRLSPAVLECVGWALAGPHGCNPDALWGLAGSTPAQHTDMARSSNGSGCLVLSQAIGVRFPYGLLQWPGGGMADAGGSEPPARKGRGSSTLPLVTDMNGGVAFPRRTDFQSVLGDRDGLEIRPTGKRDSQHCGWASARPGLISLVARCNSWIRDLMGEYANR